MSATDRCDLLFDTCTSTHHDPPERARRRIVRNDQSIVLHPPPFLPNGGFKLEQLLGWFNGAVDAFPDQRTGSNTTYTMRDIGLGAFSVFFTQSPSFLAHQSAMQKSQGNSNAQTLFGMAKIPTDNHLRDVLDDVAPSYLDPVFATAFNALKGSGVLEGYRSINGTVLVALDGTQYHSSKTIHCENCNCKTHKNGTQTFSHIVVTPVIVAPGNPRVFPLEPAFVTPQDGCEKQDCENAAAKRWIQVHAQRCSDLGVTLLGDDLYCHQPLCELVLKRELNFIFVCKPDSHPTLYEYVEQLEALGECRTVVIKRRHGKSWQIDTYRFVNRVPLRDGDDALKVDWCELKTTKSDGTLLYHNAFATNHAVDESNVVDVVAAGRSRWKVENENNNTLKTKGYHLTHNYGHGKQHLSSLLCAMIILAFLFHTLLEIGDERYRRIRQALPRRDTFFHDIRALTRYICFDNWEALMIFMMRGLKLECPDTS